MRFHSLLSLLLLPALPALGWQLPAPTGSYKTIGTYTHVLTDGSRTEIHGPPNTARTVVIQAFYPIPGGTGGTPAPVAWAPPLTVQSIESLLELQNDTLAGITTNSIPAGNACPKHPLKPLLFSTGMGVPRAAYTVIYEQLASAGYFVVAIDHPYDAAVVEYPDGRPPVYTAQRAEDPLEVVDEYLRVRVADARFVAASLRSLPCGRKLDISRIGILGHSLGGATAAGAMEQPSPISAGINLDGTIFVYNQTSVTSEHPRRPFLLVGSGVRGEDESWTSFKKVQKGWVKEIVIDGFAHGTFSDGPSIVDHLGPEGFPEDVKKGFEELFGAVAAPRAQQITSAYVEAFFGWALGGGNGKLLEGPSDKFPEVHFV